MTTDLSYFDLIVPCGISDVTMTTVQRELGDGFPGSPAVADAVMKAFGEVFDREVEIQPVSWLDHALSSATVATAPGSTD